MKKIILLLLLTGPLFLNAQQTTGVKFQTGLSWTLVKEKAKRENKLIFIDAFATWCGPCKQMETEVYTNASIGELINENFIAIKVQFDQTKNDSETTKSWYADMQHLQEKYHIDSFPTFLFLTPDDQLVLKDMGYQNVQKFTALIKKAADPSISYVGQMQQFTAGKLTGQQLMSLSLKAKQYQDTIALSIAKKYKSLVLDKGILAGLLTKELRDFIVEFQPLFTLKDKLIDFMIRNNEKSDQLLGQRGFSKGFTDYLIARELINPVTRPGGKFSPEEPNWPDLNKRIQKLYGVVIANRLLVNAKSAWYSFKKDWPNAIKYTIQYTDIQGVDTTGWAAVSVNGMVYNLIFMHSDNPVYLNRGIDYMQTILKAQPLHDAWIDTYANLLYRIGKKNEGIKQEENAREIAKGRSDTMRIKEYSEVIDKMRNNRPTWMTE